MEIYNNFEPQYMMEEPNMFWLVSTYNKEYDNKELIGGNWVMKNCPEPLESLP